MKFASASLVATLSAGLLLSACQTTTDSSAQMAKAALATGELDGRYTSSFAFKMGPATVCPSALPVTVELSVNKSSVSGVILNDGGENTHRFCALYHNGAISGSIAANGDLINVRVKQKDAHSRKYSSYKITGNINKTLTLVSREQQYHPMANFSVTQR